MKNPSIVGVLCTDSQGLNLGCKYLTINSLVDCAAFDIDWDPSVLFSSLYFLFPCPFLGTFVTVEFISKQD